MMDSLVGLVGFILFLGAVCWIVVGPIHRNTTERLLRWAISKRHPEALQEWDRLTTFPKSYRWIAPGLAIAGLILMLTASILQGL